MHHKHLIQRSLTKPRAAVRATLQNVFSSLMRNHSCQSMPKLQFDVRATMFDDYRKNLLIVHDFRDPAAGKMTEAQSQSALRATQT